MNKENNMVTKELSEAAVEFNSILEYTSEDLKNKIPKKFLDFLQSIQSKTYKFEYDKTKKLDEQKLKPKTRGLIALVYQDYICNEAEKEEYIQKSQKLIKQIEESKREKYNPNDIFKDKKIENDKDTTNTVEIVEYKESIIKRIIRKIKNIFTKK